jgi:hypothetical protein
MMVACQLPAFPCALILEGYANPPRGDACKSSKALDGYGTRSTVDLAMHRIDTDILILQYGIAVASLFESPQVDGRMSTFVFAAVPVALLSLSEPYRRGKAVRVEGIALRSDNIRAGSEREDNPGRSLHVPEPKNATIQGENPGISHLPDAKRSQC